MAWFCGRVATRRTNPALPVLLLPAIASGCRRSPRLRLEALAVVVAAARYNATQREREGGAHMTLREIIQAHPQPLSIDPAVLTRCITECSDCAESCTSCADADLAEPDVEDLVRCIRFCLDCSDVCTATGR